MKNKTQAKKAAKTLEYKLQSQFSGGVIAGVGTGFYVQENDWVLTPWINAKGITFQRIVNQIPKIWEGFVVKPCANVEIQIR